MKKVAVILSGCGVFDGAEIHESVLTLLALEQKGIGFQCFAPDINQHHVVNHINGDEMPETRNVLIESARIARGNISKLDTYQAADYNGLIMPGGFGAAKNLSKWAFEGPDGAIEPAVQKAILETMKSGKPVCALCMSPAVVARALKGSAIHAHLTVGSTAAPSPYDIAAISGGMQAAGALPEMKTVKEISVDWQNKLITAPCYMMEAGISDVYRNIQQAVDALAEMM